MVTFTLIRDRQWCRSRDNVSVVQPSRRWLADHQAQVALRRLRYADAGYIGQDAGADDRLRARVFDHVSGVVSRRVTAHRDQVETTPKRCPGDIEVSRVVLEENRYSIAFAQALRAQIASQCGAARIKLTKSGADAAGNSSTATLSG